MLPGTGGERAEGCPGPRCTGSVADGRVVLPAAQRLAKTRAKAVGTRWHSAAWMWDAPLGTRLRYRGVWQLSWARLAVPEGCPSTAVTVTAHLGGF